MKEKKKYYTEAQKKAHKEYMKKFVEVKVRMTPEEREIIKNHAEKMGTSVTKFINDAINEKMKRDNAPSPEDSTPADPEEQN